ncbi:DUF2218 domain-containing protein [Streptomyces sp. R41]|uniref:DUF2218 domain-containing protein n=1 Tax=Streptomyces sp. R41 TaxID=3238632 RepID=A0AB39RDD7_9ACTN
MPIAEARVETDRASRYLAQLAQHAQQMGRHANYRPRAHTSGNSHTPPEVQHAEWTDTHGIVRLSLGQWTMQAAADTLMLRAEADNEEDLQRIQELLALRLEKIGRRDHLTVTWQRLEATGLQPGEPAPAEIPQPKNELQHTTGARRRWPMGVVGGVVALLILAHLVLGGSVLAVSRWLGWGAGAVVLVIVLAKVIGIGALAARHGHLHTRKRKETA